MTKKQRALCVFCGSKAGSTPHYQTLTEKFATRLVQENYRLVYGGGSIGLMGHVANQVKKDGGHVTGIIPHFLNNYEVGHEGLDELILTQDMHSRKEAMFEQGDGFVILPGGLGTLDETFEILTWKQLQLHQKPIVILNDNGFWDPLAQLIDRVIDQGFSHEKIRDLIQFEEDLDGVFRALKEAKPSDEIVLTSHF